MVLQVGAGLAAQSIDACVTGDPLAARAAEKFLLSLDAESREWILVIRKASPPPHKLKTLLTLPTTRHPKPYTRNLEPGTRNRKLLTLT